MRRPPTAHEIALYFCRASDPTLRAGELIVPSSVRIDERQVVFPAARMVAGALRRKRLAARDVPSVSLAELGVDSREAPRLLNATRPPLAVVLVVLGASAHPVALASAAVASVRARRALRTWRALGPSNLLLATPRASCAGVERAIQTVELALERYGPPVYVRRQIVHNAHVVAELRQRGAIFVDEVADVPPGATLVLAAHGVAPAVRAAAHARAGRVIDATCPLVAKVHGEARRFASAGHTIVLIGHAEHEEVEGTVGEAPEQTRVLSNPEQVEELDVPDPERVAYLTQTTLAVDETEETITALRARFPAIAGPRKSDICYATQNRQDAVRTLAPKCDLMLVVGSGNSSNTRRLVEVAERHGVPAHLIDDESDIDGAWLARANTIGITAGASAPESLVQRVVAALGGLGAVVEEPMADPERHIEFKPPPI